MTSELQHFAEAFRNEADLQERLATLFSKVTGAQGVRATQGTQEYGKDIIFYSQDATGDWILNACVVKNEKITGSAEGLSSGRTGVTQGQQPFDALQIKASAENDSVAHVYVI